MHPARVSGPARCHVLVSGEEDGIFGLPVEPSFPEENSRHPHSVHQPRYPERPGHGKGDTDGKEQHTGRLCAEQKGLVVFGKNREDRGKEQEWKGVAPDEQGQSSQPSGELQPVDPQQGTDDEIDDAGTCQRLLMVMACIKTPYDEERQRPPAYGEGTAEVADGMADDSSCEEVGGIGCLEQTAAMGEQPEEQGKK